ncbi:MAG: NlpC/P60 family protein [Bacteroidota bacterium]
MNRTIFLTAAMLFFATASSFAQVKQVSNTTAKTSVKFLEDISVDVAPSTTTVEVVETKSWKAEYLAGNKIEERSVNSDIEFAKKLQFKYALLMDTEVEAVQNLSLFSFIDEWMGSRYRMGGTTKWGVDCSALMQNLFTAVYKTTLPRTAKEQYNFSQKISRTELKEGDLVFFTTIKGKKISHVGIYLQNNRFVNATNKGVAISDMGITYWKEKFVGAGRIRD